VSPSVSVVFPMYNEEAYVRRAVTTARQVLEAHLPDWEIVIVDDASTDRTASLALEMAAQEPRIKVVRNPENRRLGGALKAGYAAATRDLVFYTDADLPVDLHQLPRAVRLLEYQEADIVAAYRFDRTSEGWLRAFYTFGYNHLVRALFGIRVRDVNFAFKLFRRSVLARFPLKSEGSFIDAEFLVRADRAGCPVIQIGLDYFPRTRGTSTLASFAVIGTILVEMATLLPELLPRRRT
jgi:glycosyltransferase involved in cell wall biosynthesis